MVKIMKNPKKFKKICGEIQLERIIEGLIIMDQDSSTLIHIYKINLVQMKIQQFLKHYLQSISLRKIPIMNWLNVKCIRKSQELKDLINSGSKNSNQKEICLKGSTLFSKQQLLINGKV